MTPEILKLKMQIFSDSFSPSLTNKEINDFVNHEMQEEYCDLFPKRKEWVKDLPKKIKVDPKIYKTKKEIKDAIKNINDEMNPWIERENNPVNEMDKIYARICLDNLLEEKEELKRKLEFFGKEFNNDRLLQAKQRPISDFVKFTHNTACCVFHSEKTGSMHYYKKDNFVKCFGCGRFADVVDVVKEIHGCTLSEAINIILS